MAPSRHPLTTDNVTQRSPHLSSSGARVRLSNTAGLFGRLRNGAREKGHADSEITVPGRSNIDIPVTSCTYSSYIIYHSRNIVKIKVKLSF